MGESERENELAALEARLGAFRPGASRLDRDRVMYVAGQAAALKHRADAGSRSWRWPSAFAAMTTVAAGLLLALLVERQESGGLLPDSNLAHEANETPRSEEVPLAADMERSRHRNAAEAYTSDLDALLAQIPTGRSLSQHASGTEMEFSRSAEATPTSSGPITYVKHRRMLMEELAPANRKFSRTES
jgi:hypothetical protein